jgi:hypothetical protein
LAFCGVIGNSSVGDDEFPQKGNPTEPKGARFTQSIATYTYRRICANIILYDFAVVFGLIAEVVLDKDETESIKEENGINLKENDRDACAAVFFDDKNGARAENGAEDKAESSDKPAKVKTANGKPDGKALKRNAKAEKNGQSQNGKPHKKVSLWSLKITIITFVLSIFFSFLSEITSGNLIVAILLLLFLILGNIVFDGIGVAVTACNISPLYSMSSRRIYGARTAVNLVKNAEKVSNICSDVIGDIFGIISGACTIAIVIKLLTVFTNPNQQVLTIALSAAVAALTVGGKALIKEIAIKNSKELVMFVSRILAVFSKEERKCRKKSQNKEKDAEK